MARKKRKKKEFNNDVWITDHFEWLVEKYGGRHIVISCGEVFTGEDALKKARKKYPHIIPTSMPVPRPDEFTHILSCKSLL